MHKALRRALVRLAVPTAAPAAAAILAAPAGAAIAKVEPGTTGPDMYGPVQAGYAATQNMFRLVKAGFILPDPDGEFAVALPLLCHVAARL